MVEKRGKVQVQIRLTDEGRAILARLVARWGVPANAVIELLLRRAKDERVPQGKTK